MIEARGWRFYFGLMFRSRDTNPLVFRFPKGSMMPFTSLFCFFPFIMKWFDAEGKLLDEQRIRPFKLIILPRTQELFYKVIEIPIKSEKEVITYGI